MIDRVIALKQHANVRVVMGNHEVSLQALDAGVRFAEQRAADLRWIRGRFLQFEGDFGKMVVHGHSISKMTVVRPNRIGIDIGAFETGRLTALGLQGDERWFLATEPSSIEALAAQA